MKKHSLLLLPFVLLSSCTEKITFDYKEADASYINLRWGVPIFERECVFYASEARNTFAGDGATYMVFECNTALNDSRSKSVDFENYYQKKIEELGESQDYLGNRISIDMKFDFNRFDYNWVAKKKDFQGNVEDITDFDKANENRRAVLLLLYSEEIEKLFTYEFNL